MNQLQLTAALMLGISMSLTPSDAPADEGMWLFTNPPKKQLKERYGFEPSAAWLKNLQQSAVRFSAARNPASDPRSFNPIISTNIALISDLKCGMGDFCGDKKLLFETEIHIGRCREVHASKPCSSSTRRYAAIETICTLS